MDEIKELREEVAKLRERIAVLEAGQFMHTPLGPRLYYVDPVWVAPPQNPLYPPYTVTC